ncbi:MULTISPECIES: succinyl-diaminopimelate desuccinylase [Asticcacaulis]|uniref:succinyl-diaminopimelate desuccinylase n=1 Tax=Asticcacaulis TaxID=76890 RepID=UPI001AEAF473|nr:MULTISPECIES: succinyl-diaminopimelate desuccinylase [Asticcacaulis]MBP2159518.1 succinyl-diaminopimelate desuccinylase [Asticcacaulis solisilvae]MDR6800655.1 succinyl-diaminopimelate desuccinylase [Asticcacaulis sp. BE141]
MPYKVQMLDPVALTQELIARPSVTPADAGAMDIVERHLTDLGFACTRLKFGEIENLYARRGTASPNLCFAGHTDVVPGGVRSLWRYDPFGAEIHDGALIGRGAVDMKGAIAAWIAAVSRVDVPSSLSFLITGDEEGVATDGTVRVVEWLKSQGETIDHCIVGEPSSSAQLGDMIKVGRRGSINATFTVTGKQGHVAYPQRALNPLPVLVDLLAMLKGRVLDDGYESFQPSNLEITTIDTNNTATNVIPQTATARVNIRFNPAHSGAELQQWFETVAAEHAARSGTKIAVACAISGEAFLTQPGPFIDLIADVIQDKLGIETDRSTTGGTSDARFIRDLCPVVEFGLVGQTMHQINECVPVAELEALTDVYTALIEAYALRFKV